MSDIKIIVKEIKKGAEYIKEFCEHSSGDQLVDFVPQLQPMIETILTQIKEIERTLR